jgi:hypothetical protein
MSELTVERLRKLLSYDPLTGVWTWLNPPGKRWKRGDKAGRKTVIGYWDIGIDKNVIDLHGWHFTLMEFGRASYRSHGW